jgi:hypothetical protein
MKKYELHGMTRRREYQCWQNMRYRVQNPLSPDYKNYGGRGIKIDEKWDSFENFYADMGPRPEGFTLERLDNDGPYGPKNCIWADRATQCMNRRNILLIEFKGEKKPLGKWAKELGISFMTVRRRLDQGMPLEQVFHRGHLPRK